MGHFKYYRKRVSLGAGSWAVAVLLFFGQAEALSLEALVGLIQVKYDSTESFSASFRQVNFYSSLGQERRSAGKLYIHKPGRFRWEYTEPEQQLLVSDGETFWVYTPRLKQVIVSPAREAYSSRTPMSFLAGRGNLREEFGFRLLEGPSEGKGNYLLELMPKRQESALDKLFLEVEPEGFKIVSVSVLEPLKNKITITFSEIEEGMLLSPSLFRFEVPPGVEVVRPPRLPAPR